MHIQTDMGRKIEEILVLQILPVFKLNINTEIKHF